jgi:glucokinase
MRGYLAPIPIYAVLAEHATLRGAAIGARMNLASSSAFPLGLS